MRGLRMVSLWVVAMGATVSANEAAAPDPKAAEIIKEMGLAEAPTALRDGKGWKPPKKIVLTSMGPLDQLQAAAPGVKFLPISRSYDRLQPQPLR